MILVMNKRAINVKNCKYSYGKERKTTSINLKFIYYLKLMMMEDSLFYP